DQVQGRRCPAAGAAVRNLISMFQRFLKDVLELDFQLDDIDYTKPNFVHADLDWETFSKLQDERGESFLTIMLQSMLRQMAKDLSGEKSGPDITLLDLLAAFNSPDRAKQFKLLLGRQFADI